MIIVRTWGSNRPTDVACDHMGWYLACQSLRAIAVGFAYSPGARTKKVAYFRSKVDPFSRK